MAAGYGVDIWCASSIVSSRLDRGSGLVARALFRRLITPRGDLHGLIDENGDTNGDEESAYGFDVSEYVGDVGTATALLALPGLVRGELLKDDRVADVTATVVPAENSAGEVSLVLTASVTLVEESEQFTLTIPVSEVSATLLGVA